MINIGSADGIYHERLSIFWAVKWIMKDFWGIFARLHSRDEEKKKENLYDSLLISRRSWFASKVPPER